MNKAIEIVKGFIKGAELLGENAVNVHMTVEQLSVIEKALQSMQWRPISEADKRMIVDLWNEHGRHTDCVWDGQTQSWYDDKSQYVHEPAHFMNLPPAPQGGD